MRAYQDAGNQRYDALSFADVLRDEFPSPRLNHGCA